MHAHSRAPWARKPGPYGALIVGPAALPHPGKDAVAYAVRRGTPNPLDTREADAALIGAAPDMLAALRFAERALSGAGWLGAVDGGPDVGRALDEIRAAIAKAEGRG